MKIIESITFDGHYILFAKEKKIKNINVISMSITLKDIEHFDGVMLTEADVNVLDGDTVVTLVSDLCNYIRPISKIYYNINKVLVGLYDTEDRGKMEFWDAGLKEKLIHGTDDNEEMINHAMNYYI